MVVDAVLGAMRKYPKVPDVARYGAKALENLASRSGKRDYERGGAQRGTSSMGC